MNAQSIASRARQISRRARSRLMRGSPDQADYRTKRPPWGEPDRVRAFSQAPADESFITGNGIAARCRYVLNYDDLVVNERGQEDWWFCKADYLDFFFAEYAPTAPFVLFTHNSDRPIDRQYRRELGKAWLRYWFAQNPVFRHPKLRALPIGIANPVWEHGDQSALKHVQHSRPGKSVLFDVSFNPDTNREQRERCLSATGLELAPRLPYEAYLERLASSYFCISPNGNGIDCVRTWEALYVGTIPVVTRSLITEQHSDLPMVVIDDWSEFARIDFSPSLYTRLWGDWKPDEIRLDRYFERIEQTIAGAR